MPRLHRNNAAEWVMVIALSPIAWVMLLFKRSASVKENKKPAPRRAVMIEGLPPRTMN